MSTPPIACQLSADQLAARRAEIARDLRPLVRGARDIDGGVELRFDGDAESLRRIADFIAFERRCCAFLSFELQVPAEGRVVLRLTGPPGSEVLMRAALG